MLILAVASGAADDASALTIAADLARRHNSHVTVIDAFANAAATAGATGLLPPAAWRNLIREDERARAQIVLEVKRQAERFVLATTAGAEGGSMSIARRAATPWESLKRELALADFVVVPQSTAGAAGAWTGPLGESLMQARATVYVARGEATAAGRPAAIAWDGSLEAGRAVRAALPLLKDASSVAILQDPDDADVAPGALADPERLRGYLPSWGIAVGETFEAKGRNVGAVLLEKASSIGAALLVAGAFGHSRIGEALFGGATRSMLEASAGPHLLVAH
jgi:nucleotide-binding universal stress UspA family protein